jgi:exodeoxyribonuclease VII large subunit
VSERGHQHHGPVRSAAGEPHARANEANFELRPPEPAPGSTPATAIDVSTLTEAISDVLAGAFPRLWVRGEISDFKRYKKGGQWYFSLRDGMSTISCVMWAQDTQRMPAAPDEGTAVLAYCDLKVYLKTGQIQMTVRRLKDVGDGIWRKAFEATRKRLEADGLLEPARKRKLPHFPRCIAVVTSADGAALHDIETVVRKRCPSVELVLIPATVQGDEAPRSLCRALTRLKKWGGADLVIFGRGGGSREDLWAFNDEKVARALAACSVPTIAAIGHQVDVTICDLVADYRAPTPSAAAEAAVPVLSDLQAEIADYANALRRQVTRIVSLGNERLTNVTHRLRMHSERAVERRRMRVDAFARQLHALSPLATLGRGYAAVFDAQGAAVSDVRRLSAGDHVNVRMRDGSFTAQVDATTPGSSS